MAQQATEQITIDAPPERVFDVALDFERYPQWAADIKEVEVENRDDEGRGTSVRYRTAAMGQSARYTLAYDYSDAPHSIAWKRTEANIMRVADRSDTCDHTNGGTHVPHHV